MMSNNIVYNRPRPNPSAKMTVFCFPFAGGSSTTFHAWLDHLHLDAEIITVQMPARGSRLADEPCDNMGDLVESLFLNILPLISKPYLFFGHSMGSKVAFELARKLHQCELPMPVHFISSGCPAPFLPRCVDPIHALPEAEFIDCLAKLNGTPERVLRNRELMSILMPALRADFKILETYIGSNDVLLPSTITLCGGAGDKSVAQSDILAWRSLFQQSGDLHMFDGGHFFINDSVELLVSKINHIISSEILCSKTLLELANIGTHHDLIN